MAPPYGVRVDPADQARSPRTEGAPRWWAAVRYTLLRLAVLAACWVAIQLVTGLRGLPAAALAILLSGAISLVLLTRQRDAYSANVFRVLRRINDRIEASARAEDAPDPGTTADGSAQPPDPQQQSLAQADDEQQQTRPPENGDQGRTASAPEHGTHRPKGDGVGEQGQR